MAGGTFKTGGITRQLSSGSAATNHSINVPSSSSHLLLIYGGALNTYAIVWVAATSTGTMGKTNISLGDGITVSTSTNTLTIAYSSSRNIQVTDIVMYGSPCTL